MADTRRTDYDHEPAYRRIAAQGGRGWDDLAPDPTKPSDSYDWIDAYLAHTPRPRPGARALEVGCGGGQITLRLARAGWTAYGIDYSETAIELARKNARDEGVAATFVVADALDLLPVESGSMDLVVDGHALHCVVEPPLRARFLSSVRRVLATGGRFVSETMSCEGDFDPARVKADPVTKVALNRTRIWIARDALLREVEAAGLRVIDERSRDTDPGTGLSLILVAEPA